MKRMMELENSHLAMSRSPTTANTTKTKAGRELYKGQIRPAAKSSDCFDLGQPNSPPPPHNVGS